MSANNTISGKAGTLVLGLLFSFLLFFGFREHPFDVALNLFAVLIVVVLAMSNHVSTFLAMLLVLFFFAQPYAGAYLTKQNLAQYAQYSSWAAYALFGIVALLNFKTVFKITLASVSLAIAVGIAAYTNQQGTKPNVDLSELEEGNTRTDTLVEETAEGTKGKLVAHHRVWAEDGLSFAANLELLESDFKKSAKNHRLLEIPDWETPEDYWRQVYVSMSKHDGPMLGRIVKSLKKIQEDQGLNPQQLASATVGCVQNIPYVLVHTDACDDFRALGASYKEMHDSNKCKPDTKFGLQSPGEFVYDLQGDCDTRTVLLYTLLDKLGYKVAVMNSEPYGHSILGVAIPGSGLYKEHKGYKYYAWETTSANWLMGSLSPTMNDMGNWVVVMAN